MLKVSAPVDSTHRNGEGEADLLRRLAFYQSLLVEVEAADLAVTHGDLGILLHHVLKAGRVEHLDRGVEASLVVQSERDGLAERRDDRQARREGVQGFVYANGLGVAVALAGLAQKARGAGPDLDLGGRAVVEPELEWIVSVGREAATLGLEGLTFFGVSLSLTTAVAVLNLISSKARQVVQERALKWLNAFLKGVR